MFKLFDLENDVITDLTEDPTSYSVTSSSTAYSVAYYRASISSLTGIYNNIKNTFYNSSGDTKLTSLYDSSTTNAVAVISIGPDMRNDSISSSTTVTGAGNVSFTLKDGSVSVDIIDWQDTTSQQSITNVEYYGKLIDASSSGGTPKVYGEIFYNYGLMVLHGFGSDNSLSASLKDVSTSVAYDAAPTGSDIGISNLAFISTVEQSQQIFFARLLNKEYNYSNNPTFADAFGLITASFTADPVVYITTVGLYNEDNQLLAVAKLSQPLEKSFTDESLIRCVLRY